MEAVGQLTGGLAHDFNNLLTGISGSLEMMQTRCARRATDAVDRYLAWPRGRRERAAALTHRLLAFSRRQTLDPQAHRREPAGHRHGGPDPPHAWARRSQVEMVGAAGLWPTRVDPGQLENALLNLCINARDAMPDGGRLTIETANRWLDERAARERVCRRASMCRSA